MHFDWLDLTTKDKKNVLPTCCMNAHDIHDDKDSVYF